MSNEKRKLNASLRITNETHIRKCWAAISNDIVIETITMKVSPKVDFDKYRASAISCLELLGQVRAGELVERDGETFFIQRKNHARRSKNPQPPKEFLLNAKQN
ncbi:MAG: hypothetical protein HWE07_11745 [Cytophagia bacterium]|nr:hypothetical protein [Cytophagia bacterium]